MIYLPITIRPAHRTLNPRTPYPNLEPSVNVYPTISITQ